MIELTLKRSLEVRRILGLARVMKPTSTEVGSIHGENAK
jgi:hypothetical protein